MQECLTLSNALSKTGADFSGADAALVVESTAAKIILGLETRNAALEGALDKLILACPACHTTAFLLAFQNAQRLLKSK